MLALLSFLSPETIAAAHEAVHEAAHEAQPLIDLDNTVFVQLGLFLLMLVVLHFLVFKPFLQARGERDDRIEGERRRAQEMEAAAQAKIADFEGRLEKAKQSGVAMAVAARGEAGKRERAILDSARTEAQALLESQRKAAQTAGEAARVRLARDTEGSARRLASRILGREVA